MKQFIFVFATEDTDTGANIPNSLIPDDSRDAGGFENTLSISVGARVMLNRNIFTQQGLVNGALGTVHSIDYDYSGLVSAINVNFDDSNMGRIFQIKNRSNYISIERIDHTFIYDGRHIVRSQSPLVLAYACTIHKVQGLSCEKIVLDSGKSVFEKGMRYAALSRVKTRSGLCVLKLDPKQIQPPNGYMKKMTSSDIVCNKSTIYLKKILSLYKYVYIIGLS